jgi:hypothetical protein
MSVSFGRKITPDTSRDGVVDDGLIAWPERSSRAAASGRRRPPTTSSWPPHGRKCRRSPLGSRHEHASRVQVGALARGHRDGPEEPEPPPLAPRCAHCGGQIIFVRLAADGEHPTADARPAHRATAGAWTTMGA